jgi:hypothetical protein
MARTLPGVSTLTRGLRGTANYYRKLENEGDTGARRKETPQQTRPTVVDARLSQLSGMGRRMSVPAASRTPSSAEATETQPLRRSSLPQQGAGRPSTSRANSTASRDRSGVSETPEFDPPQGPPPGYSAQQSEDNRPPLPPRPSTFPRNNTASPDSSGVPEMQEVKPPPYSPHAREGGPSTFGDRSWTFPRNNTASHDGSGVSDAQEQYAPPPGPPPGWEGRSSTFSPPETGESAPPPYSPQQGAGDPSGFRQEIGNQASHEFSGVPGTPGFPPPPPYPPGGWGNVLPYVGTAGSVLGQAGAVGAAQVQGAGNIWANEQISGIEQRQMLMQAVASVEIQGAKAIEETVKEGNS